VQCIVIGPVCAFVCVCVFVGLLPWYLEIACINLHQIGSVGESSDHLQLIKFWQSCVPRKGVCGRAKPFGSTLLQPARSVCISLSTFFIMSMVYDEQYKYMWMYDDIITTKSVGFSSTSILFHWSPLVTPGSPTCILGKCCGERWSKLFYWLPTYSVNTWKSRTVFALFYKRKSHKYKPKGTF